MTPVKRVFFSVAGKARLIPQGWLAGFWLVVGMGLRLRSAGWFPLREDEALYSYWARLIASGRDVMLERVAVDKPPFFLYALARWFQWFGPSDASGRSLNLLISFLTLLLVWALARRLFGPQIGRWALAFYALSPFAISFAPTVYTDPMLTLWLVLALLMASWRLGLLAGLALGMGFATKQNALLFIPLVLLALPLGRYPQPLARFWQWLQARIASRSGRRLLSVSYHLQPIVLASLGFWYVWFKVWQWDSWRILPAEIPDFWTQSWHSYGGLSLTAPAQWPERLQAWWQVGRWWGGMPVATVVLVALAVLAVRAVWPPTSRRTQRGCPNRAWIWLFALYAAGYAALHLAFSFQPWDRYLLPLAPLSAILSACGAWWLWHRGRGWRSSWRWGLAILLLAPIVWGAGRAAEARIPVGGDHGAYNGLLTVADFLRDNTPAYHGVVYQRWLGWQWDWYLWDGPPRVYWATPQMLVADLAPDRYGYTRFVVFPGWHLSEKAALQQALAPLGLHLIPRLQVHNAQTGELSFEVDEIGPHIIWQKSRSP